MHPKRVAVDTVDEYIALFSGDVKTRLEQIRKLIIELLPDTDEGISYAIPAYKYKKKPVVYFAGYEKHIGMYPLPKSAPDSFTQELAKYQAGKGTVRFDNKQPLPLDFITNFVKYRYEDSLEGQ